MSDEGIEIDENSHSPGWEAVKANAYTEAVRRLDVKANAVTAGAHNFERDAAGMIDTQVKIPPRKPTVFGALAEALLTAGAIFVPEATAAAEILEAAKTFYEVVKPSVELVEEMRKEVEADRVDDLREKLREKMRSLADDMENSAVSAQQLAGKHVSDCLDRFIDANPRPLGHDERFYGALCDGIGITEQDAVDIRMSIYHSLMGPFKHDLSVVTASIHFFKDFDTDSERLKFLVEEVEPHTDVHEFLQLIGADVDFWMRWIGIYHKTGDVAFETILLKETPLGAFVQLPD
jgi:hypothetical protein